MYLLINILVLVLFLWCYVSWSWQSDDFSYEALVKIVSAHVVNKLGNFIYGKKQSSMNLVLIRAREFLHFNWDMST